MFLTFFVIGIGGTIIWIWTIIDCATNEPPEGNDRLIWTLIVVLTHWIGALIYLLVRKPKRIEQYGK
ncbi:MAG: PLDc N-terminal domain-containing protein [Chloroflexota bacterium]|nr:PLDc N-terminal domain-containing protein [Chloroflexota bacterium]